MRAAQLSQVVKGNTSSWPGIVVVLAGTLSAITAAFNLTLWVSVTAAIAAVLGGLRVLQAELLVPIRLDIVERATGRVMATKDGRAWEIGTAVHVGQRRWVTGRYIADLDDEVTIQLDGQKVRGRVVYRDEETELAVVLAERDWSWRVRIGKRALDRGEKIKVAGLMRSRSHKAGKEYLVVLDFVVQAVAVDSTVILMGSFPPMGFGGAPAVETRTGPVVGILTSRAEGQFEHLNETYVAPLSRLPKNMTREVRTF